MTTTPHRYRLIGLMVFVVANIAIFRLFRGADMRENNQQKQAVADRPPSPLEKLRNRGSYTDILTVDATTDREQQLQMLAQRKLGAIDVIDEILATNFLDTPPWWTALIKALYLRQKDDLLGAEQVLSTMSAEDRGVRSLLLAFRAQMFCEQKLREECMILAEDSVALDAGSPYALYVQAMARRIEGEHGKAKELFERATLLSGSSSDRVRFNRGIALFFTRDYEQARADLESLIDDPVYSMEARLYLGRLALSLQETDEAYTRFFSAASVAGTGSRTPYLWLGRTAMSTYDRERALAYYQSGYALAPRVVELLADMIVPANYRGDQDLLIQLGNDIKLSLGTSAWNYRLAANKYKQIYALDQAEEYLRKGVEFAEQIEDEEEREKMLNNFNRGLGELLVQQALQYIVSGTGDSSIVTDELATLAGFVDHLRFLRGIQSMVIGDDQTARGRFRQVPGIVTERDELFIKLRYLLLTNNPQRALEIVSTIPDRGQKDVKLTWIKWGITKQLDQPTLVDYYEQLLRDEGWVNWSTTGTILDEFKRRQALSTFSPWIDLMAPYLRQEYLRLSGAIAP